MINFKEGNNRFNYRISGITIHDGKVLLYKGDDGSGKHGCWSLPGGRAEFLEDSSQTLVREYKEESGTDVKVGRLVWFVENFFENEGENYHEILLIYIVSFVSNTEFLDKEEFYGEDDGKKLTFRWVPLDELEMLELYPAFLRKSLRTLPEQTERIIERD